MARRSYDRMYKEYDVKNYENNVKKPVKEEKIPEEESKVEEVEPEQTKEEVKEDVKVEEKKPSTIKGTVIGGASLNVRNKPNGDVVNSLKEGTVITIIDESDTDWYKIESPEGYVMKKFVRT